MTPWEFDSFEVQNILGPAQRNHKTIHTYLLFIGISSRWWHCDIMTAYIPYGQVHKHLLFLFSFTPGGQSFVNNNYAYAEILWCILLKFGSKSGASFEGELGGRRPLPPQGKRKKEKRKKKKRKKRKKKKGTLNNVKLLHIKCCFFQFFNSPVALKNKKKFWPPKKKLK